MTEYDNDNIFAKIIRGDLPSETIYEDADTVAIMDIMPRSRGHALVLPKQPSRNILDIEPDALAAVMRTAKRLARAAKAAFGADGVTLNHFVESAGGQVVFHTHVHVLPRYEGQALKPHTGEMAPAEEIAAAARAWREALAAG